MINTGDYRDEICYELVRREREMCGRPMPCELHGSNSRNELCDEIDRLQAMLELKAEERDELIRWLRARWIMASAGPMTHVSRDEALELCDGIEAEAEGFLEYDREQDYEAIQASSVNHCNGLAKLLGIDLSTDSDTWV